MSCNIFFLSVSPFIKKKNNSFSFENRQDVGKRGSGKTVPINKSPENAIKKNYIPHLSSPTRFSKNPPLIRTTVLFIFVFDAVLYHS